MWLAWLLACGTATDPTDPVVDTDPGDPPVELPEIVVDTQSGDPGLASVDRLAFAPAGHLILGDGAQDRVLVFDTAEIDWDEDIASFGQVADLAATAADVLGVDAADVRITDAAVNPASGRTWVGVERQDEAWAGVLAVQADGGLESIDLAALPWVAVDYPEADGPGSIVSDIEWTEDHLVLAVTEVAWTPSQVVTVSTPIAHGAAAAVSSTRTYHRSHRQWETFAPISSMFSWSDGTDTYVATTYHCAPVVRFDVEALAAGEPEVVGVTPFDYGPGRQVLDFAVVGEGTDAEILASVSNLGGTTVAFDVFTRDGKVDEEADVIFSFAGIPEINKADLAPDLDDALRVEPLDAERIVVFDGVGLDTVDRP